MEIINISDFDVCQCVCLCVCVVGRGDEIKELIDWAKYYGLQLDKGDTNMT